MPKHRGRRRLLAIQLDGTTVRLGPREHEVYRVLQQRAGVPISPEDLELTVTGEQLAGTRGHWARVTVLRLKQRLAKAGLDPRQYVRTVYGRGYCWIEQPTENGF